MKKFVTPSMDIKEFARTSILTDSTILEEPTPEPQDAVTAAQNSFSADTKVFTFSL